MASNLMISALGEVVCKNEMNIKPFIAKIKNKKIKKLVHRKQLLNILYYIYQLVASLLISFKTLQEKIKGVDSILKVL